MAKKKKKANKAPAKKKTRVRQLKDEVEQLRGLLHEKSEEHFKVVVGRDKMINELRDQRYKRMKRVEKAERTTEELQRLRRKMLQEYYELGC